MGRWGRAPSSRLRFFPFHAIFRKKMAKNNRLAPPPLAKLNNSPNSNNLPILLKAIFEEKTTYFQKCQTCNLMPLFKVLNLLFSPRISIGISRGHPRHAPTTPPPPRPKIFSISSSFSMGITNEVHRYQNLISADGEKAFQPKLIVS